MAIWESNFKHQETAPLLAVASLRLPEVDHEYESRRRIAHLLTTTSTSTSVPAPQVEIQQNYPDYQYEYHPQQYPAHNETWYAKMFPTEFIGNTLIDMVNAGANTERPETVSRVEYGIRTNSATLIMNASNVNTTESSNLPELFYRHSLAMTAVYCVAYLLVFAIGLVGNCFVIAVVFRTPRMRTVTNFFIVNLAVADILVIIFCLPATLMSNIFVREYSL